VSIIFVCFVVKKADGLRTPCGKYTVFKINLVFSDFKIFICFDMFLWKCEISFLKNISVIFSYKKCKYMHVFLNFLCLSVYFMVGYGSMEWRGHSGRKNSTVRQGQKTHSADSVYQRPDLSVLIIELLRKKIYG